MVSIRVYQSLTNSALKEKRLKNINNLYKTEVKCNDEQRFKSIIEAAMVSTTEGLFGNSPI